MIKCRAHNHAGEGACFKRNRLRDCAHKRKSFHFFHRQRINAEICDTFGIEYLPEISRATADIQINLFIESLRVNALDQ